MLKQRDKDILRHLEQFKAISLKQADKLFFQNYKTASRRLLELEERELVKSYKNKVTDEKVYYIEDKLSAHDLLVMEFYTELIVQGAKVIKFTKPHLLKDMIRPDAFIEFQHKGDLYFCFLEVDLTHFTSFSKLKLYEKLSKDGEIQKECYGVFPSIVILREHEHLDLKYVPENFEIIYMDFKLTNFYQKIF